MGAWRTRSTIAVAAFAFGAGYAVARLSSPFDFDLWMSGFVTDESVIWNWCPKGVATVLNLETSRAISSPDELRFLCAVRIEERVSSPASGTFQAVYRAQSSDGQESFVEYDAGLGLFRVDGQVFRSRQFQRNLEKYR